MSKITCCICGKEQSGWIQDYSLTKEFYDDRVCVDCNEHLQNLLKNNKEDIQDEIEFFQKHLQNSCISINANKYLSKILDLIINLDSEQNINQVIEESYTEFLIAERNTKEKLKSELIITTGNLIDGYRIVKYIDVISEEKIVGVGIKTSLKSIGDIFAALTGEELFAITKRINELKSSIKNDLKGKAVELGANAIIGIDIETTIPAGTSIFVSINGTAVKIEKVLDIDLSVS